MPRCLLAVIASCINLIFHTPALSNTPVYGDNMGVLPRCLIFFWGGGEAEVYFLIQIKSVTQN